MTCVPAGPQDSSVRDAGHTGHWAQRVIEASPVQNGIRQDRIGARDTVKGGTFCIVFSPLKIAWVWARWRGGYLVRRVLMNVCLQGHSLISRNGVL